MKTPDYSKQGPGKNYNEKQPSDVTSKESKFDLRPKIFNLDEAIKNHEDKLAEDSDDVKSYLPETKTESVQEPEEISEGAKQHDASPIIIQPEPKTDKE